MAKIVEVKEEKKAKQTNKNKIDLGKIKKVIDDNPEAVKKIKDGVTDIIASNILGSKSSSKTTKSTKSTAKKSSSSDSLSKVMDLAGTFLKK